MKTFQITYSNEIDANYTKRYILQDFVSIGGLSPKVSLTASTNPNPE